ncbi:MAG: heme exporter protein CcmD [Dokdonella sp.]
MSDFLAMGGYGFYVWASYGVFLIVLLVEAIAPVLQRRRVLASLRGRYRREDGRGSRV